MIVACLDSFSCLVTLVAGVIIGVGIHGLWSARS